MGHKILLADDSITVQKIVKLTFSDEGVEVTAVGNGELAVQKLSEMRPDLVMADVFMPGKDGYEVCEYVKTHPELRHTPVILLVHAFEPFDQERALRVGADQHLTKPFQSIRALVTTVKEMMASPAAHAVSSVATASASPSASTVPASLPVPAGIESVSDTPCAEVAFTAADTETAFTAADREDNLAVPDNAPTLPTFTTFETPVDLASAEVAPFTFSTQADHGTGEVLEEMTVPEPQVAEAESFLPSLMLEPMPLEDASATETESASHEVNVSMEQLLNFETAGHETHAQVPVVEEPLNFEVAEQETNVNVPVLEEMLNFEATDTFNSQAEVVSADVLSADSTTDIALDTAPLTCQASAEETSEVLDLLDLDAEPTTTILSEEIELLPEITSAVCETPETTMADAPVASEPYAEAPVFTEAPLANESMVADALPILAEFETPAPTQLECAEPDFVSTSHTFNGYDHDQAVGQAQPFYAEQQTVNQDAAVGVESAQATGFNLNTIPPGLIDEIARRVVEQLSEKAIQEIAWEVVPELAELLIRRQLTEKVPH